ncbi:hypothetical protein CR513_55373, partial [Mucuna pruriens]
MVVSIMDLLMYIASSRVSDMKKLLLKLLKRMNRCMLSEAKLPKHFWGETLYTIVHVINLNPAVALNTEVADKIWSDKDVNYDHLRVFGCKAFVHVPKDERSKLNMKTRQCIFIGYSHDEYGYKMYDPVEKKLVRSYDVQFMEDQTIEDIDKVKKSTLEKDISLSEIDPNGEQHNYVGDQQLEDGFDVPLDDDVDEEQEMSQDENPGGAPEPPLVELRRPNKQRQSSTRYISNEYVTLTNREKLECYRDPDQSAIHLGKNSTFHSRSKHVDLRYHWIHDALDAKLLELTKVHTNENSADIMTKTVPRGKFEACCEITRLAITST